MHRFGGRGGQVFLQGAENLDPLDRVDAELGFEILVHAEHVGGVTGALGDDVEQLRLHCRAIHRRSGSHCDRDRGNEDGACCGRRRGADRRRQGERGIEDGVEAAGLGELLHAGLHRFGGRGGQVLLQGAEDFHALDGVDAEFGFEILVQAEHVGRVTGAFGDDVEQLRLHRRAIHCGSSGSHGGNRDGHYRGRGSRCQVGEVELCLFEDGVERLGAGVALHAALHHFTAGAGHALLEGAEDFHALDRVDAEFGFEILVQAQHVAGIAGALGDDFQQGGLRVEGGHDVGHAGDGDRLRCHGHGGNRSGRGSGDGCRGGDDGRRRHGDGRHCGCRHGRQRSGDGRRASTEVLLDHALL